MNNNRNLVPRLRFPGFTDDWEQRKCGELCSITTGKLDANAAVVDGDYKFFTCAREDSQIDTFAFDGPSIIIAGNGDVGHTKYYDGKFNAYQRTYVLQNFRIFDRYLKVVIDKYLPSKIVEETLGSSMPYIKLGTLTELEIPVPDIDEQKGIGKFFELIDNLITLHQRKLDAMKEYKKGMLQKMFPKEGTKKPEIRFPGFTDDWEQRKLGDIIDKLTGGASIAPNDYVEEGYRTIPKGAVNDTGVADMSGCKCVSEAFFKKNISSKTSTGELVTSLRDLVPTAPNMGRIVRIYGDSEDFLMPQGVYSIILKKDSDEDFLIAYSNSPDYRKIIATEKNGSTQVHIRNGEFLNIDIPVPTYDEQKRIGATIKNLDNLITLHQRKLDAMKEYKEGLLQQMFA